MNLLFEFRCKGTTFFSNIQKSRAEKELFYLYPLDIVRRPIVPYIELSVTEDLYSLSFGEGWNEVFSICAEFKPHGDIAGTESGGKAGGVVYCAEAGIGVRTVKSLIEKDDAVVAIEHQIAGVDCAGLVCGGGKRGGQVMVFLIAVQFVHRDGQGQQRSKGFAGFGVCKRGGKGLRTDDDVNRCLCHKGHCAQRKNKYKQSFHFLNFTFSHFDCKITAFSGYRIT